MAKTIGQLTQTTTIAGGDEFVIERSGQTKRVAASVVRGGLVNADIDAAAAIAYSKLDLDDSIVTNDLTDDAVTTAKILDANVTPAKLSQPFTLATAQASTSGTSIDFTGIPSWAKRITVMFSGVSTNGTSVVQIQLGSGTYQISGYASASFRTNGTAIGNTGSSTGLVSDFANTAGDVRNGSVSIVNIASNTWVSHGALGNNSGQMGVGTGTVSLSGTLDRVRITTVNGTDTFDAGTINISYEG